MDIPRSIRSVGVAVSKAGGRPLLIAQKYSPEILTGVGIVAGVGATVVAARQTLKLDDTLEEMRFQIALVKEKQLEADDEGRPLHDPGEINKELAKAYFKGSGQVFKLYLPALTLTAISIASTLGAHGILHKRNVALLAAYKLAEENYAAYRERVREELGEDKDLDFVTGASSKEEKDKEGNVKVVSNIDPTKLRSNYGRFFDESNVNYKKDSAYNLMWLKGHEAYYNQLLQARGHVFLNEVYDTLGFPRTKAGAIVGWVYGNKDGDNHVDFGMYDVNNPQARAFVNGDERSVYLDFNIDGVILDLIETPF